MAATIRVDIWRAARRADAPALAALLDAGVHVDEADDHGVTPLMLAASVGSEQVVELLLQHGASVTRTDLESGYTPLHRALLRFHFAVAAKLVHAGATVDSPLDRDGLSPLALLAWAVTESPMCRGVPLHNGSDSGFLMTWGAAGSIAIGRGAGASSHAVAVGRVELGDHVVASSVAASKLHTLVVDGSGQVLSFGLGVGGRLGHGDEQTAVLPRAVRLSGCPYVREVAAGIDHSVALTSSGELWTWGSCKAPLGYEVTSDQLIPRRVRFAADRALRTLRVATSDRHALVCTRDSRGAVACYGWGSNDRMQLAMRLCEAWVVNPRRVEGLSVLGNCLSLSCGGEHSAGVAEDGAIYCWGHDSATPRKVKLPMLRLEGGIKSGDHHHIKHLGRMVTCGFSHTTVVSSRGEIYVWTCEMQPQHVKLPAGSFVVLACAANYSTIAVTAAGLVYSWKEHWHSGKVPRPQWHSELRQVVSASISDQHSVVVVAERRPFPHSPYHSSAPAANESQSIDLEKLRSSPSPAIMDVDQEDTGVRQVRERVATLQTAEVSSESGESSSDDALAETLTGRSPPSLMSMCECVIQETVTTRNCLQLWFHADTIGAMLLRDYCRQFVLLNLEVVLLSDLWTHLPPSLLASLGCELRCAGRDWTMDAGEEEDVEEQWQEEVREAAFAEATSKDNYEYYTEWGSRDAADAPRSEAPDLVARYRKLRKKLKQAEELERKSIDGILTREERLKVNTRQALADELLALTLALPELDHTMILESPNSAQLIPPPDGPTTAFELQNGTKEAGTRGVSLLQGDPGRDRRGSAPSMTILAHASQGVAGSSNAKPSASVSGPSKLSKTRKTKWKTLDSTTSVRSKGGVCAAESTHEAESTSLESNMSAKISGWEYVTVGTPADSANGSSTCGWKVPLTPSAVSLAQIQSEEASLRHKSAQAKPLKPQVPLRPQDSASTEPGGVTLLHFVRRSSSNAKDAKDASPKLAWTSPNLPPSHGQVSMRLPTILDIQREQLEQSALRQEQRSQRLVAAAFPVSPNAAPHRTSLGSDSWSLSPTLGSSPTQSSWGLLPEPTFISLTQIQTETFLQEEEYEQRLREEQEKRAREDSEALAQEGVARSKERGEREGRHSKGKEMQIVEATPRTHGRRKQDRRQKAQGMEQNTSQETAAVCQERKSHPRQKRGERKPIGPQQAFQTSKAQISQVKQGTIS